MNITYCDRCKNKMNEKRKQIVLDEEYDLCSICFNKVVNYINKFEPLLEISSSKLSERTKNALRNNLIQSIGEAIDLGEKKLLQLEGMGVKGVKEILNYNKTK